MTTNIAWPELTPEELIAVEAPRLVTCEQCLLTKLERR